MKICSSQRGITVLELLAVVVVLSILLTIAVPNVQDVLAANEKRQHLINAKVIRAAAQNMVEVGARVNTPAVALGSIDRNEWTFTVKEMLDNGWIKKNDLLNPSNANQYYGDAGTTASKIRVVRYEGIYYYDLKLCGLDADGTQHTYIDTFLGTDLAAGTDLTGSSAAVRSQLEFKSLANLSLEDIRLN